MGAEVLIIGGVLKDPLCAKITYVKELPRNEESSHPVLVWPAPFHHQLRAETLTLS